MVHSEDLIQTKLDFMRADLQLAKTFLTMASIERDLKNNAHFMQLKTHIRTALATMTKMVADIRIPIPEDQAEQISQEIARCQTAYDAL